MVEDQVSVLRGCVEFVIIELPHNGRELFGFEKLPHYIPLEEGLALFEADAGVIGAKGYEVIEVRVAGQLEEGDDEI